MVSISYFEAESNHAQILVAIIHKCFEVNLMAQQWKIVSVSPIQVHGFMISTTLRTVKAENYNVFEITLVVTTVFLLLAVYLRLILSSSRLFSA